MKRQTDLERLEQQNGRITTAHQASLVSAKVAEQPGALTDTDLLIVDHFFGGKAAAAAREAREQVRHPRADPPAAVVTAPATPAPSASMAAANDFIVGALCPDPDPAFDREAFSTEIRTRRARFDSFESGYDAVALLVASRQFDVYPAGLTDTDLHQLGLVDPDLADRARAARAGYEKQDYVDEHAAELGQMPASLFALFKYAHHVRDALQFFVFTVLYKVRECASRIDALERGRLVDPKDAHGPLRMTTITAAPHTVPAGSTADAGLAGRSVSALGTRDRRLEVLEQTIADLQAENAARKREVVTLSAKPSLVYQGVWLAATTYAIGSAVTHNGNLWIAKVDQVQTKPGESKDWQLAVRRGSDGRDGKAAR